MRSPHCPREKTQPPSSGRPTPLPGQPPSSSCSPPAPQLPQGWVGFGAHPGCGPHRPARCVLPSSWRPRGNQGCSGDQGGRRGPGPGRSECWGQGPQADWGRVQGSTEPHLAREGDRYLPHGLCVPDIGTDDLSEGLLNALEEGGECSEGGAYHSHRPCLLRWGVGRDPSGALSPGPGDRKGLGDLPGPLLPGPGGVGGRGCGGLPGVLSPDPGGGNIPGAAPAPAPAPAARWGLAPRTPPSGHKDSWSPVSALSPSAHLLPPGCAHLPSGP